VKEHKMPVDIKDEKGFAVGRLVEFGRQKGFLTYDDISDALSEEDKDLDHLVIVFSALLVAGVALKEDANNPSSPENESGSEGVLEENKADASHLDHLVNIDPSNLIDLYFNDAARHPILTTQEEVVLAKRIERGRKAREELSDGINLSPQQKEELPVLVDDGWLAVETLITSNSRLVISMAKKYVGRGVSFLDLIQEGNIGLIRAAKKFEYQRGYKFSTYATWWIRQAVTRALADQGRTIRVPVHISEQLTKMFRAQHELSQVLGRDPKVEEIAEALMVPPTRVQYMIQVAQFPLSLETPTMVGEDSVLGDFIEDVESPDPDEIAIHSILRQQLEQTLEELPPREVQILKLRFGLTDGKKYTLREAGEKMGVTRERIRQIEAKALQRLRQPRIWSKFRGYLSLPGN